MISFLVRCRQLVTATQETVCLVMGNEACDLDSAVSAIALASFYTKIDYRIPQCPTAFVPVLNIPRKMFPIKTEVQYFLRTHNISSDMLIFKDDIDNEYIRKNPVILVDHHVSPHKNSVVEVFDHRPEDPNANLPHTCNKTIELVGSCATLIANLILHSRQYHDEFKVILELLHGAILMDTVNFSPQAGRTTALDTKVASEIEQALAIEEPLIYRAGMFRELVKAREDVSSLTAYQLLNKDMKLISNSDGSIKVSLPGYPIAVQDFIKKPDSKEAVTTLAKELNCSVVLLIGMKIIGLAVTRDIGLINISNQELFNEILDKLMGSKSPDLQLQEYENCDFLNGRFFQQANVKATRKHILPILKDVLDKKE